MSLTTPQLMTAEDLWQLPDNGMRRELIDGVLHETMPQGGVHGAIAVILATLLRLRARQHGGYAGVEAGHVLQVEVVSPPETADAVRAKVRDSPTGKRVSMPRTTRSHFQMCFPVLPARLPSCEFAHG